MNKIKLKISIFAASLIASITILALTISPIPKLFWICIAIGAAGVIGSNLMYLNRLNREQKIQDPPQKVVEDLKLRLVPYGSTGHKLEYSTNCGESWQQIPEFVLGKIQPLLYVDVNANTMSAIKQQFKTIEAIHAFANKQMSLKAKYYRERNEVINL